MHTTSRATTAHLGTVAFRQQCERFLGIMDDAKAMECYIKMYGQQDNPDFIDKEGVTRLLHICYTIAMQHSGNPVLCPAVCRFVLFVNFYFVFVHFFDIQNIYN